jgi:hypothetical protein
MTAFLEEACGLHYRCRYNRTACFYHKMMEKIALSVISFIREKMPQIIDDNDEFRAPDVAAPPLSTAAAGGISTTVVAAPPLPPLPGHLQDLIERTPGYVEAASSANTRRADTAGWRHFSAWCRRQNLSPPRNRKSSDSTLSPAPPCTTVRGDNVNSVSTIERRLSAIVWICSQRGTPPCPGRRKRSSRGI